MIELNTPMGPGFFIFFQGDASPEPEVFSGGYEFHPYAFQPKIAHKAKGKEEKKAAKLAEETIEVYGAESSYDDLELILRLKLRNQAIEYKAIYFEWVRDEFIRVKAERKRAKRNKDAVLLLLH